jgi:hypothetical protein
MSTERNKEVGSLMSSTLAGAGVDRWRTETVARETV